MESSNFLRFNHNINDLHQVKVTEIRFHRKEEILKWSDLQIIGSNYIVCLGYLEGMSIPQEHLIYNLECHY